MSIKVCTKNYLFYFDVLSIKPSRSSQKSFFSSMLLLTCGAYALIIFRMDPFNSSFMAISLSDTLFTSRTLSSSFSLTTISISFFFYHLHCKIVSFPLQYSLLYYLSTLFPVGKIFLHFFALSCLLHLFPFQSLFQ